MEAQKALYIKIITSAKIALINSLYLGFSKDIFMERKLGIVFASGATNRICRLAVYGAAANYKSCTKLVKNDLCNFSIIAACSGPETVCGSAVRG